MKAKKMTLKYVLLAIVLLLVLLIAAFTGLYFSRLQTIRSVQKVTDYEDGFQLYKINILYDYNLDQILSYDYRNEQTMSDAILKQAIPLLPIHMESPDYGCSSFGICDTEGHVLMGRNYDFTIDTSALMVYCAPKDGYRSVGMAAMDHVGVTQIESFVDGICTLPAPFICLDGMNEKGVSIAILMLDSKPVRQDTSKPDLFTTLAVRLVLDRAASTQEAVDLLRSYDMYSVAGGDYHFLVTDASGDTRVIEYDCHSQTRDLVDLPVRSATNFYQLYIDKVLPNQYNDIYGHGKERYDRMEELFSANEESLTRDLAWQALVLAQQLPSPDETTSNTQWSILYDDTDLTAEIVLRRDWDHSTFYDLSQNAQKPWGTASFKIDES